MLHLLQHRIGQPGHERVAGDEQDREPVRHRDAGGGDHVRRAGADGRRGHHDLLASHRLREGRRREAHALLVLPAPHGDLVAVHLERVAQARDVAVPEDPDDAREQRHLLAVDDDALGDEVADDRLRRGDPDGARHHEAPSARSWTDSHVRESQESMRACWTLTTSTASRKPGEKRVPVASASRKA